MSENVSHGVVSCAEMKELERAADAAGLSYYDMMENAGKAAAGIAIFICPSILSGGTTYVFAGSGNNAGDGFVLARILKQKGADVKVVLVSGEPKTTDAITNFKLLKKMDIEVLVGVPDMIRADLIVDALYGTGFHGEMRSEGAAAVELINSVKDAKVLAIDIPSGLPGDVPADDPQEFRLGPSVIASTTVTFHAKKQIHEYKDALDRCGNIIVADIGISDVL
ncbi:MAG: NAD(P)H-hydrate epimerase [Eubacteriaceae bacterium]|jgi:NAD(P)H-hydrate epimerase|nr:NAD(P)H-hydrate epimerase [Eubacteriaceae bacterium]